MFCATSCGIVLNNVVSWLCFVTRNLLHEALVWTAPVFHAEVSSAQLQGGFLPILPALSALYLVLRTEGLYSQIPRRSWPVPSIFSWCFCCLAFPVPTLWPAMDFTDEWDASPPPAHLRGRVGALSCQCLGLSGFLKNGNNVEAAKGSFLQTSL